jgi:trigger factor
MKIKKSEKPEGKIELKVTAPASKVQEAIRFIEFQLAMQNGVMLQGIEEPGALTKAVKEKVGEAYYNSFIDFQVMNFLAPFAITQEKLSIIGPPKVTTTGVKVDPARDLEFRIEAVAKPTYEITDFSPVKIQLPKINISEEDIDNQLLMMADSRATYEKDEDRPVNEGDDILFAIKTLDEKGEELKNLTAEKRNYKLGEDYMPVEFDDNLLGMQVGETKTFDVSSPFFNMNATGNPEDAEPVSFTFTITILEIQKRVIPAITDTWVEKNVPPLKTVTELREEIRQQGVAAQAKELTNMKSYLAASEFSKRMSGSIPDELYELTRDDILHNMQQQLQAQGKTLQEYIAEQAGGEQQFSMQLMMQTREVLVQGFSLDALARHLKLEVTEDDIAETFSLMAPGHEYEARSEFETTGRMYLIQEGALRNKANKWLVENAEIEEIG